jgi:molybdopterin converting factor small subunit
VVTVTVRYFAKLKEEAGLGSETVETSAATVSELWEDLRRRHPFSLAADLIRAAQDDEFCSWDAPLVPGVEVVLMPPVAGG